VTPPSTHNFGKSLCRHSSPTRKHWANFSWLLLAVDPMPSRTRAIQRVAKVKRVNLQLRNPFRVSLEQCNDAPLLAI
jgi:hypothetical protein